MKLSCRLLEGDLVLRTLEEVYEPVPAAEGPSK